MKKRIGTGLLCLCLLIPMLTVGVTPVSAADTDGYVLKELSWGAVYNFDSVGGSFGQCEKKFDQPVDLESLGGWDKNLGLQMDVYLNGGENITNVIAAGTGLEASIELTSSGQCDRQERAISLAGNVWNSLNLNKSGWTRVVLPLNSATFSAVTNGSPQYDNSGPFDPAKLNYMRIYIINKTEAAKGEDLQMTICKVKIVDTTKTAPTLEADPLGDGSRDPVTLPMENLKLYGRTYPSKDGALNLFWSNSGFAFRMNGTKATAKLTSNGSKEAYVNVYVDGAFEPTKTIKLNTSGTNDVVLADNLSAGEHTIEVRKRTEMYSGTSSVSVTKLEVDGTFLAAPAASDRTIEFIGDSITSGMGNLVTDGGDGTYYSKDVDGTMTYAALTARELGADASMVSRSGIGFCTGAVYHNGNEKDCSWYPYYTKTAALPNQNACVAEWDFAAHKSDVVVINLGTNDQGAKYDGAYATSARMTEEAVKLLQLVREKNPDAVIIWTYGMMGQGRYTDIKAAVDQLTAAGDNKMYFLLLDPANATTEGKGVGGHPTVQSHLNRATVLAQFIAEKTGWTTTSSGVVLNAQLQLSGSVIESLKDDATRALYSKASVAALENAAAAARTLAGSADTTLAQAATAQNALWKAATGLRPASEDPEPGDGDGNGDGDKFTGVWGDIDKDGQITSTDARLALQYYAGKIQATDSLDLKAADVDGDEKVTSTDARLILQRYVGKIEQFPVEITE